MTTIRAGLLVAVLLVTGLQGGYGQEGAKKAPGTVVSDSTSTSTLVVAAQSLTGLMLEGVELEVSVAGEGRSRRMVTNDAGRASLSVPAERPVDVRLADDRWREASRREVARRVGGRLYFLELYPADPRQMTAEERAEWLENLPRIFQSRRQSLPRGTAPSDPLAITALLLAKRGSLQPWGYTVPAIDDEEQVTDTGDGRGEDDEPGYRVQLVDGFGRPVAGLAVELYALDRQTGTVELVRHGRTDSTGVIYFRRLDRVPLYRIITPETGFGLGARSSILAAPENGEQEQVLVSRETARTLAGVVLMGDGVLPMARVTVLPRNDQPALETRTDEWGYFELGPLQPGPAELEVRHPGSGVAPVRMPVQVGIEEIIVPYDVLLLPTRAAESDDELD